MNPIVTFFTDYTIRNVALGSAIVGIVSGSLGSFAVLRNQSLLGDAVSHAALPGIAVVFLLTRAKEPFVLLLGAAVAGWLGTVAILHIVRNSRIKEDSAMGIVLSVFFGVGILLLTFIQKLPTAAQAGLDKYLFGQAATLMTRDVMTMGGVGVVLLIGVILFWKEFKLITFDREFGESLGFPMRLVDVLLSSSIVLAIVVGLQAVGVVLMSAMIVTPAVSARQWTDRLSGMVVLSGVLGAVSGVTGALISSTARNVPTGPTIVVVVTAVMALSLLFGSKRGLVWTKVRNARNRKRFALEGILRDLRTLEIQHGTVGHGHTEETIDLMRGRSEGVRQGLGALMERGYVERNSDGTWNLTGSGRNRAEEIAEGVLV